MVVYFAGVFCVYFYFAVLDALFCYFDCFLSGVGTYIAISPAPEEIKAPLAVVAYVCGMIGFAIKEALGGRAPISQPETKA